VRPKISQSSSAICAASRSAAGDLGRRKIMGRLGGRPEPDKALRGRALCAPRYPGGGEFRRWAPSSTPTVSAKVAKASSRASMAPQPQGEAGGCPTLLQAHGGQLIPDGRRIEIYLRRGSSKYVCGAWGEMLWHRLTRSEMRRTRVAQMWPTAIAHKSRDMMQLEKMAHKRDGLDISWCEVSHGDVMP
jgi:hypothetical protein